MNQAGHVRVNQTYKPVVAWARKCHAVVWRLLTERDGVATDVGAVPLYRFSGVDRDGRLHEAHQ